MQTKPLLDQRPSIIYTINNCRLNSVLVRIFSDQGCDWSHSGERLVKACQRPKQLDLRDTPSVTFITFKVTESQIYDTRSHMNLETLLFDINYHKKVKIRYTYV